MGLIAFLYNSRRCQRPCAVPVILFLEKRIMCYLPFMLRRSLLNIARFFLTIVKLLQTIQSIPIVWN